MEVIRSLVDDLNTERGIVRLRVALLLRFSEIKPLFSRSGPIYLYIHHCITIKHDNIIITLVCW